MMTYMPLTRRAILLGSSAVLAYRVGAAVPPPVPRRVSRTLATAGSRFVVGCDAASITSLRYRGDQFDTDYVRAGVGLGEVIARVRSQKGGEWVTVSTVSGVRQDQAVNVLETEVRAAGITLTSRFAVHGQELRWEIIVAATGSTSIEVGDLALPLPMHTSFESGRPATQSVLKHSFVSGHGSHIFWMRPNSVGPYLMLLPAQDTALEYWQVQKTAAGGEGTWAAYIHAAAAGAESAARGTRWRLPLSSLHLTPGEVKRYAFRFLWVDDYASARTAISANGLIDVEVVPGMTVPSDLHADIALASSSPIERITAEHEAETILHPLPHHDGRQRWRVTFARMGENRLTLHQAGGRRTELEFFATEPLETMIGKRAAFIARRQHRDETKWYDGLLGEWNMATGTLLGPDNYDRIKGWRIYEVTCDDPGLSKPAYLAAKNAEHPVAAEIAALDLYIERFVWGGLQMTTAERYPYAIYGILDWKKNRTSVDPGSKGRLHIWRPYDYPHIFAMYHAMHRVARDHPGIVTRLDAAEYLRRAGGTALAMFTVPAAVVGWSAYETGFYNECVIPELIDDLRRGGMDATANALVAHWARKVRRFVSGHVDLFGSEYAFDSTGFESTQALARSAIDRPGAMGVTKAAARAFADRQIAANLFCRGWLEPAYYYLGSDYRGSAGDSYTLTYMAQMGGWAVLDHALHDACDPYPLLRLGYASQLSSWALLNAGPSAQGHGYWYPGEENDGGAGGGFEPAPEGVTWLDQPHHRGSWYYSCEIDLGFCGALRAARTIVADDPVFGRIALGGKLEQTDERLLVTPCDGVRRRLSVRAAGLHADVELHNARFAAHEPVTIAPATSTLRFRCEEFVAADESIRFTVTDADGGHILKALPVIDGFVTLPLRPASDHPS